MIPRVADVRPTRYEIHRYSDGFDLSLLGRLRRAPMMFRTDSPNAALFAGLAGC